MPETRCICCDLPVESCGKEIERRQRAEAATEAPIGVWFYAQYPGFCAGCGDDFNTGDRIALASAHGGHRCYVAQCCKEVVDA